MRDAHCIFYTHAAAAEIRRQARDPYSTQRNGPERDFCRNIKKRQAEPVSACLFRDPGGTQTHDLQNRNLTFYSTKLRGRNRGTKI